jgi:hypothetical protein
MIFAIDVDDEEAALAPAFVVALTFLIGFLWLLRGYGSISHCSQPIPPTFTMSVAK